MAGKGAAELWGSSKNDTDLQQNHKNDRVDNRMVVISDLKKRNKIFSGDKEVNNNAFFTSLVAILKKFLKYHHLHLKWLNGEINNNYTIWKREKSSTRKLQKKIRASGENRTLAPPSLSSDALTP